MKTYSEFRQERHEELAPYLEWEEFYHGFIWNQGEHVAMIGPTESGKTTLAIPLLAKRKFITVLCTKPRDETLEALKRSQQYRELDHWEKGLSPHLWPKRLLWPDALSLYSAKKQQKEFKYALEEIYREGGWCVYVDELWFIVHHLRLEMEIRTYLQQARSNNISLVVATQRPSRVPVEIYDQSKHLFFWRDNDERNLRRISGIAWLSASQVMGLVARLRKHEFLYINTVTGEMVRSKAPAP